VTFAFDTGSRVNYIKGAIAFGDGVSGAFGQACATGDAVFIDFHGHGLYLLGLLDINLIDSTYSRLKIPEGTK
jgi:hypothetical protein